MSGYDPTRSSFYDIVLEPFHKLEDEERWEGDESLTEFSLVDTFDEYTEDGIRDFTYYCDNSRYIEGEIDPDSAHTEVKVLTLDGEELDSIEIEPSQDTVSAQQAVDKLISSAEN